MRCPDSERLGKTCASQDRPDRLRHPFHVRWLVFRSSHESLLGIQVTNRGSACRFSPMVSFGPPSLLERIGRAVLSQNTIRGPRPAVCFTEQTLQAAIQSRSATSRYSGCGIAYHKSPPLYTAGGRPVIYNSKDIIGRPVQPGEEGYVDGADLILENEWFSPTLPASLGVL